MPDLGVAALMALAEDERVELVRGSLVEVRDASGDRLSRRALSGILDGASFPIVWACREEEWLAALEEGREPQGTPWPAEDVRVVEEAVLT